MTNGDRWMVFGLFSVAAVSGIAALVVYKIEYTPSRVPFPPVHMQPEVSNVPAIPPPSPVPIAEQAAPVSVPDSPPESGAPKQERYPVSIEIEMHREPLHRPTGPKKKQSLSKEKRLKRDWERARMNFPNLFNMRG